MFCEANHVLVLKHELAIFKFNLQRVIFIVDQTLSIQSSFFKYRRTHTNIHVKKHTMTYLSRIKNEMKINNIKLKYMIPYLSIPLKAHHNILATSSFNARYLVYDIEIAIRRTRKLCWWH